MTKTTKKTVQTETQPQAADIVTVPLGKLIPDPKNVRRYQSEAGIDDLCAMIVAEGLLQNLAIRPAPKGKFYVTAGSRRLRALNELAKRGAVIEPTGVTVTKDYPVRVFMLTEKHRPTEVSLVENIGRSDMHVADEIEAFKKLNEEDGLPPEEIAARFGMSHMTVRRRLKLAGVSSKIIEELRQGKATLEQVQALAITDDQAEQERAYFEAASSWQRRPDELKAVLTSGNVASTDRLAIFVGIEAYEQAGGNMLRDLFSTSEGRGFLTDRPLLVRLATERLTAEAEAVKAEGWKWCEPALEQISTYNLRRIYPETVPLSAEDDARLSALAEQRDGLESDYSDLDEDSPEAESLYQQIEAVDAEMDALQAQASAYKAEEVPLAGVFVTIGHDGGLRIERGIVRDEDAKALDALRGGLSQEDAEAGAEQETTDNTVAEAEEGPKLSDAVIEDLTKTRTAALAYELSQRPDVALVALVHALAVSLFYTSEYGGSSITPAIVIKGTAAPVSVSTKDEDNEEPFNALAEVRAHWKTVLPAKSAALWDWCMDAKPEDLHGLMAYLVAATTNAVDFRHESASWNRNRLHHADRLAEAVNLDMGKWWKPGHDFFKRVPKAVAAAAVTEAGCDPKVALAIMKAGKQDAIAAAEEALEGRGWLPKPLHTRPASEDAADPLDDDAADFAEDDDDAEADEAEAMAEAAE